LWKSVFNKVSVTLSDLFLLVLCGIEVNNKNFTQNGHLIHLIDIIVQIIITVLL
jgi:hypothetical protein